MWARLDDQFYLNPKNARMDRDEQDLHLAAIVYCSGQLTDGFVPSGVLILLCAWARIEAIAQANAQAIAQRLVEHGYWELAENGYMVHDFLEYNPSREEVLAMRAARSEAGRRGGQTSAAHRQAFAQANANQTLEQMPSKIQPRTRTSTLINNDDGGSKPRPKIYDVYEKEIGLISEGITHKLHAALEVYPEDWIIDALHECARQNVRRWAYAEKILENRKNPGPKSNGSKPVKSGADESLDELIRSGK